ncbi:pirin family protein [Finegoldia magna]|uniref:pirin family protein n=1 Tax=Finegoldia magna TaxID=1260 RepID=UPI0028053D16|nr:pirin family protein [Finegoldia magna]MDU2383192.1 pirin family protein [Finegoldia magna]MDU5070535.1 pirin family protein [Finegoldia magna]
MKRKILNRTQGFRTKDGAGVSLVRVLSRNTTKEYDPILMLDSFDSTDPEDYIKGFPMHPHRGIETITYLREGTMTHKDSMGNEDTITDNEVQWMTAGSGIMHEEMPKPSKRMLGVQLWLNLLAKDKMVRPHYQSLRGDDLKIIEEDNAKVKVISGEYKGIKGYAPKYLPLDFYEIEIKKNEEITIDTKDDQQVILFTLIGDIEVEGDVVSEKTAVTTTDGDKLTIKAKDEDVIVLFLQSIPTNEPIAWAGPIVMNTNEDLRQASLDLRNGTFIKEKPEEDQ